MEFDSLTSALKEMSSNVVLATVNSGSAKNALHLLEISAMDLFKLDPAAQMGKIAEGLLRVKDGGDRAQLAMQIFGSEGANLLPIIEQGADGIKKLQAEAQKLGASLSKEECDAMTKFNSKLSKLHTVLIGLITAVLVPILPMITSFFEAIREGHPAITFFNHCCLYHTSI